MQFADDTSLTVLVEEDIVHNVVGTLATFSDATCLLMNLEKSVAYL